jgi:RHS repeat-associated protein
MHSRLESFRFEWLNGPYSWQSGAAGSLCDVGHQGLLHDKEFGPAATGLVHNRARTLNPHLGRFNQRDPLGYPDGMNGYEYEGSTPSKALDPQGNRAQVRYVSFYFPPRKASLYQLRHAVDKSQRGNQHNKIYWKTARIAFETKRAINILNTFGIDMEEAQPNSTAWNATYGHDRVRMHSNPTIWMLPVYYGGGNWYAHGEYGPRNPSGRSRKEDATETS